MYYQTHPHLKTSTYDYTVQKLKVCICSRAPHYRTVLQNRPDKTLKPSPKKQSIIEYSPGHRQYTKSLLWKPSTVSFSICKIIRLLFSTTPPNSYWGDCGWIVGDLETVIVLVLTRIQFHSSKVTPLTDLGEVTLQGLCYCNSNLVMAQQPSR